MAPKDPKTMSLGRGMRAWQRWLMRPMGWGVVIVAVVATEGLAYLSPRPFGGVVDWRLLGRELSWRGAAVRPLSVSDRVWLGAVLRMSAKDYAELCPMQVRPKPTEVVRVGTPAASFEEPGALPEARHSAWGED